MFGSSLPPIAGQVFDGPLQGVDLVYTKDYDSVSYCKHRN